MNKNAFKKKKKKRKKEEEGRKEGKKGSITHENNMYH